MTQPPAVEPLAEALAVMQETDPRWVGNSPRHTPEQAREHAPSYTDDAEAILAAMPDHTIVSEADLAALRAVAEAARGVTTTHLWTWPDYDIQGGGFPFEEERQQRRSAWAELVEALARLTPETS